MAKTRTKKPLRRSKKPTKDEVTETTLSLLGGNLPPTRDLLYHYETIAGHMDRVKTAQGKLGDAKKTAKEAGVDVSAMMDAMKKLRLDPLELAGRLRQEALLLSENGSPVQIMLFETKYGSVDEQASAEGLADGRAARSPNVERWKEGAPGQETYMAAWHKGQKENAAGITKPEE